MTTEAMTEALNAVLEGVRQVHARLPPAVDPKEPDVAQAALDTAAAAVAKLST